jgi:hypothetical protein
MSEVPLYRTACAPSARKQVSLLEQVSPVSEKASFISKREGESFASKTCVHLKPKPYSLVTRVIKCQGAHGRGGGCNALGFRF